MPKGVSCAMRCAYIFLFTWKHTHTHSRVAIRSFVRMPECSLLIFHIGKNQFLHFFNRFKCHLLIEQRQGFPSTISQRVPIWSWACFFPSSFCRFVLFSDFISFSSAFFHWNTMKNRHTKTTRKMNSRKFNAIEYTLAHTHQHLFSLSFSRTYTHKKRTKEKKNRFIFHFFHFVSTIFHLCDFIVKRFPVRAASTEQRETKTLLNY